MKICIQKGNTKIGKALNVSLPAGISCPEGVPCYHLCYARKLSDLRKTVKDAWMRNWEILNADMRDYFNQISEAIEKQKPEYFRWHVSGDIPSLEYFHEMVVLAKRFKEVHFACYTKTDFPEQWLKIIYHPRIVKDGGMKARIPPNLSILRSVWGEWNTMPGSHFKKFVFVPRGEDAPRGAFICLGRCEDCHECWYPRHNVYIHQH